MPESRQRRGSRTRLEVAAEAARIIATEGQRSYLAAKQKAAERLRASGRGSLPSNAEVEAALKEWHEIYGDEQREALLADMHAGAAEAMRFLEPFKPRLVGPLVEGTADAFSRICLHLFADDPDAVVHYLMERHIPFEQERRRVRWHDGEYRHIDVLVVEAGDHTVEMALMVGRDALQALPSPIDGRAQKRLSLRDVEALLAEPPAGPAAG